MFIINLTGLLYLLISWSSKYPLCQGSFSEMDEFSEKFRGGWGVISALKKSLNFFFLKKQRGGQGLFGNSLEIHPFKRRQASLNQVPRPTCYFHKWVGEPDYPCVNHSLLQDITVFLYINCTGTVKVRNCGFGPHADQTNDMVRISHKRSHFLNYERTVTVKL